MLVDSSKHGCEVKIVGVDRIGERREEVLAVGVIREPHWICSGPHSRFGAALGELGVVAGVSVAQRLRLFVFGQAFLAVLADGLQQPVPGVETTTVGDDQRPGHEVRQATRARPGPRSARRRRSPPPHRGCTRRRTPPAGRGVAVEPRRAGRRTSRSWLATSAGASPPVAAPRRAGRTVDPTPRPTRPGSSM